MFTRVILRRRGSSRSHCYCFEQNRRGSCHYAVLGIRTPSKKRNGASRCWNPPSRAISRRDESGKGREEEEEGERRRKQRRPIFFLPQPSISVSRSYFVYRRHRHKSRSPPHPQPHPSNGTVCNIHEYTHVCTIMDRSGQVFASRSGSAF